MSISDSDSTRGVLLIADLVDSTKSKHDLFQSQWQDLVTKHNDIAIEACRAEDLPQPGKVVSVQGDGVVSSFDVRPGDEVRAFFSSLRAAERIVTKCREWREGKHRLRTKITLHFFTNAFLYRWVEKPDDEDVEFIGPDIDAAFRVSGIAWHMQTLVTHEFAQELLRSSRCSTSPVGMGDVVPDLLLREAAEKRDRASEEPTNRPWNMNRGMLLDCEGHGTLEYWVTDARCVQRLKGIPTPTNVYLLGFRDPAARETIPQNEREELRIKLRQGVHAVVMVDVTRADGNKDRYLSHVIKTLQGAKLDERLDSQLTLCVAAGIYGAFDFFFRVSCVDDQSLGQFFSLIQDPQYRIGAIDVRQTIGDRFRVNPATQHIISNFSENGRMRGQLVLTWFEKTQATQYDTFLDVMAEDSDHQYRRLHVLEAGEVIHGTPVYALFWCESLSDYVTFFERRGISTLSCHSHIVEMHGQDQVHLRYGQVSGIYLSPLPTSHADELVE